MQAAYQTTVDVELNMLYRTVEGCSSVLDNLLQQGGCGPLVAEASVFARYRGQGIGFVVVTEIAPGKGTSPRSPYCRRTSVKAWDVCS